LPILAGLLQDTKSARKLVEGNQVSNRMRAYAAYGIGLLAESSNMLEIRQYANHVLVQVLKKEHGATPDLHAAAVIGLGLTGAGDQHIETLLNVLASKSEHDDVRAHAPTALAKLALRSDATARQRIASTLMEFANRSTEKASVQQGCMLALGQILRCGPTDAALRKDLQKLAKSGKTQERGWAMISLAQIASRPEAGSSYPLAGSLITSAHALAMLNQSSVVGELIGMFEDCSCLLSTTGLTSALARTRHPDAIEPLLAQLGEDAATNSHRALAAVALGNLAAKAERPWGLRLSQGINYRAHVSTLTEADYGILLLP
jgi:hypothetical protein